MMLRERLGLGRITLIGAAPNAVWCFNRRLPRAEPDTEFRKLL